ncbi:MAG: hypothetical protein SFV15_03890 [Polyangiaceae bacterium]|nr:hypothetical protein [Polyangiaceae bacterium]
MIVDDLDIVSVGVSPAETDAPLVVDSNAMLADAVACELLKAVSGRNTEIEKTGGSVQNE